MANVSVSLLSKIEVGDRTLTPTVAATIGRALGLSMAEVLGKARVAEDDEERLTALRSAVRDYDLPGRAQVEEAALLDDLESVRRPVTQLASIKCSPGYRASFGVPRHTPTR